MMTGCTIRMITNADFLLERSSADLAEVLR